MIPSQDFQNMPTINTMNCLKQAAEDAVEEGASDSIALVRIGQAVCFELAAIRDIMLRMEVALKEK